MATFTNTTKNVSTFSNPGKTNLTIGYLLTDALDFILAGLNSDETLIINDALSWSNTPKT